MLENQKLHNQLWRPSWMIDGINGGNFGRGLSKEYLDQILFFHSVSVEEDFQRSPILQPIRSDSSHLAYRTRSSDIILKEGHLRVSHSSLVQFGPMVFVKKIKM